VFPIFIAARANGKVASTSKAAQTCELTGSGPKTPTIVGSTDTLAAK